MDITSIILLALLIAGAATYAVSLVNTVKGDGLSRRPPPASHWRDPFDPGSGPTRAA